MTIVAAASWHSNADLIVDIAALGYIKPDDAVIDLTFGRGTWWKKYRHPGHFVGCVNTIEQWTKLSVANQHLTIILPDFHDLRTGSLGYRHKFDVVAFDPPYVSTETRSKTTIPDFYDRYGLVHAARTPALLCESNNLAMEEATRILRPGGYMLVKCCDYISSGKLFLGTHWTLGAALDMGLECVERFEHVGHARAQPPGRRQVHARRNLSTMFIFRNPRKAKL